MSRKIRDAAARSRFQVLDRAISGVTCRCEALERRLLLSSEPIGSVAPLLAAQELEVGIVRGFKFEDANGNSEVDQEDVPVEGATIFADLNNDGQRQFNEPTVQTNAGGEYEMQIPAGPVVLREVQREGWEVVSPAGGAIEIDVRPNEPVIVNWLNRRRLDWGDAPDGSAFPVSYPTLAANNGARHWAIRGYSLGSRIDPEPNGQPHPQALGDDLANIDDGDGVTFLTPLVSGSMGTVQVDFTSIMGLTGVLDAWIDFNADGDWNDPGERIANTFGLVPGVNFVSFPVPAGAMPGDTFGRFRLSPNGVSSPQGTGYMGIRPLHGEVEDHLVGIEPGEELDWGDAPDGPQFPGFNYRTLAINNGARHTLLQDFTLGRVIDAEVNGQPSFNADGDDVNGAPDDEDGVDFLTPLVPGQNAQIEVTLNPAAGGGFVSAWIDFNGNGTWTDAGEQILNGAPVNPGANAFNIPVPATAKAGQTYARFRLAQTPSAITSFAGFGGFGEVEDYRIRIDPPPGQTGELDWGDAPDIPGTVLQYPTLASSNGARHSILAGYMLGGKIDPDADGQPTILADGDDGDGSDDEDGVTFLDPFIPGNVVRVEVFLTNTAGAAARLDAWIDWERDGNWTQAGNQIANAVPLNPGPNILFVNVPADAKPGRSYARFRLSREGGLPFDGFGDIGEVEDYVIKLEDKTNRKFDWGDAPEPATFPGFYHTLAANNGAHHVIQSGFQLGWRIDAEADGQPTINADGDDFGGFDDEDGVTFLTPLVPGGTADIQVVAPAGGVLDAWVDFYGNFNWSDPPDRIFSAFPLVPGVNNISFPVPADAKLGETYARFRLSPNGVLSYDGFGFEGEVEDYRVRITPGGGEFDWGDARQIYPTLAADGGAHHEINPDFVLGNLIDAEPDGQPSAGANRDDLNGVDDEDGVTLIGGVLLAGSNAQFQVVASAGGVLDAWIDLNIDGDWDDPGEHVFVSEALVAGANGLSFPVPPDATPGDTYARFRLTREGIDTYKDFGGEGEVEDYLYTIRREKPDEGPFDWGDAPGGENFPASYPTLAANDGAHHSHVPGFTLGRRWDSEPDGQPSIDALRDDFVGIDDEDGVEFFSPFTPGDHAEIRVFAPGGGVLDAWIDWDGDGDWSGPDERIATGMPLVAGENWLFPLVPEDLPRDPYRTYARFRLSREGVEDFTGFGGEGEVEDYRIVINGPSVSHDPFTGIVHVVGTDEADHVLLNFNPETEMLEIFLGNPPDDSMPDFALNFEEIKGLNFVLGDGDDVVYYDGFRVIDISTPSSKGFGFIEMSSFDGGEGMDSFILDASGTEIGLNFVVQPELIQVSPSSSGGDRPTESVSLNFTKIGFELTEIVGGNGGNRLLLPAVQKVREAAAPMSLNFVGGPGDDELQVFVPPVEPFFDEIFFDGGPQGPDGPGDMLSVFGPAMAGAGGGPHFEYMPAPGLPDTGQIVGFNPQPEPPGVFTISFTGLEPVHIASGDVTLTLPAGATGNDVINIDAVLLDSGDSNVISGLSNGTGFEHLAITDVGMFTLNVAGNDMGGIGGSSDVVNFNGSLIGAAAFEMVPGVADLTLNINGGEIPIGWDPGELGAAVTVNVGQLALVRFETTQHLAVLNIGPGGTAVISPGRHTVVTKSLLVGSPNGPGRFDITDGNVIVNYTGDNPFLHIWDLIAEGRHGGSWDGVGITSSVAASDSQFAVGIGDNAVLGKTSFAGEPVGDSSILLTLTLGGDANLDWQVTIADLGILAANWQQTPRFWHHGNFNFDPAVTIADLGILAANWQKNLGPPPFSVGPTIQDEDGEEAEADDEGVLAAAAGPGSARALAVRAAPAGRSVRR